MDWLKFFSNKPTPKEVAKDRLKLILIHDRGNLSNETLELIKSEILEVLSRYIEIDVSDVDIAVTTSESLEGNSPSLVANIPIKNVRSR
ncbi:cell division topological specificity factor [Clostridium amylolyticum]|uniref:Cell division topological specificity factor n=1 Tax=Clostridium amylolyticum TaxID=1121298 RepID=A0A1M6BFU4_9CLOT|nr:cell division topological specificity factor MinE [Clostridium amylolyticum]SHI47353.1 cell division topological specificity factor [Clostridium amylolyticum]